MKYLKYVFLALIVMFCTNCQKSTEPIGNDKPPPGYQEDIPWPSLADSPWPMNHGDPQSTGRSKFPGPISGTVIKEVEAGNLEAGVSIGPDSTIYYFERGYLIALWPDGETKWQVPVGEVIDQSLTIDLSGNLYALDISSTLHCISPYGAIKWSITDNRFNWSTGAAMFLSVRWRRLN